VVDYARDVLKGRWETVEKRILKSPNTAIYYAGDVIGGRWQALEFVLKNHPLHYQVKYANAVLSGFELEKELLLLKSTSGIVDYVRQKKKAIWPECESLLLSSGTDEELRVYLMESQRGPWPELEEQRIGRWEDREILEYATRCKKGRVPQYEDNLIRFYSSEQYAYCGTDETDKWVHWCEAYISQVVRNPWPEMENALVSMMKDGGIQNPVSRWPLWAIVGAYTKAIGRHRWPELETTLLQQQEQNGVRLTEVLYCYARWVCHGKLPGDLERQMIAEGIHDTADPWVSKYAELCE
jgi:hypothetical protein